MRNENAVSAVYGVILMVATICIVAAILVFALQPQYTSQVDFKDKDLCTSQNLTCYHFNVGDVLNSDQVLNITEKWMFREEDGSTSYYARASGKEFTVDPELYHNLPTNVTGYGFRKKTWTCGGALFCLAPSVKNELLAFHRANFTQNGDIINEVVIIP